MSIFHLLIFQFAWGKQGRNKNKLVNNIILFPFLFNFFFIISLLWRVNKKCNAPKHCEDASLHCAFCESRWQTAPVANRWHAMSRWVQYIMYSSAQWYHYYHVSFLVYYLCLSVLCIYKLGWFQKYNCKQCRLLKDRTVQYN